MKRVILYVSLMAVAVTTFTDCSRGEKKEAGQEGPMPVTVALPETDSITLYKTYPGFLGSNYIVDVVCQVNGKLLSKNYTSGDYVNKGQVLFTVDPSIYRDRVTQAEAQLATARSSYEYYSKQYAAMQKALEVDAVSQMDVIQSKSNLDQAQAAIATAEAALQTARTNLSHCTITAPISGYISSATLDVGNYLAGEGAPVKLCTIYDNSEMVVSFSIEDGQYEDMLSRSSGSGDAPMLIPLEFSNPLPHEYVAKLYYVDVTLNKSTGTLTLKGHVDNPYNELKNSMYANASFPYGTNPHAILVKDASISTDQAGKYLYTVNDSNKVVYTPIEVGELYHDSLRIVTKGIDADTRYVTSALLKVRDGMEIKPVLQK